MPSTTLISALSLRALMTSGHPWRVFDCSYDLGQPALGYQQYLESHLPEAVYANLGTDLSAHQGVQLSGGRHPLPTREAFAAWLGGTGMTNTAKAVVYDRNGNNFCARLWWMLKWAGHADVAVLDGGLQAWTAAGGQLETGSPTPPPRVHFSLAPSTYNFVTTPTVAENLGRPVQTLVDARGAARYRGEVEPLDPVAGHIPGALNRPFSENFETDGRFKSPLLLKAEFDTLLAQRDASTVVHYCGSGVSALTNFLAMEVAGYPPTALYAGSWSEWCSDPERSVARG